MKQKQVKLPSGEYCLVGNIPDDTYKFFVYNNQLGDAWADEEFMPYATLPPGSWQLLGADPTRLTEEEAGEIVEDNEQFAKVWKDYVNKLSYRMTAAGSLSSLAASLGIEKPFVVLKNIEK